MLYCTIGLVDENRKFFFSYEDAVFVFTYSLLPDMFTLRSSINGRSDEIGGIF